MGEDSQRKGFWGTTLNKLKSVLAKTKEQVSEESVEEQETASPVQNIAEEPQPQVEPLASTATAVQTKSHRPVDEPGLSHS